MKQLFAAFLILCSLASGVAACDLEVMHGVPIYGSDVACSAPATFDGADANTTVVIPAGQTVTLSADATVLDVLVRGELVLTAKLTVRTVTAAGGILRVQDGGEIVIRDAAFADYDASQWGIGVLAIGGGQVLSETDDWRDSHAEVAQEINAGDTLFQVQGGKPYGWRAGDVLVLPDTRQPATGDDLSAWTETATVASVSDDGIVYLTAPVQHDHHGWHASDGTVGELFDVGCLTQPITIRSENPTGTRGHVAAVAGGAMHLQGVQVIDCGRTTTAPLGPTNIVGRYATHFHHNYGLPGETRDWQGGLSHCSVWNSPKWGVSIHNAYFVNVEDCCFYDCAGGGIVTEQVHSYGFRIADNMVVAKSPGSGQRITERSSRNDSSATADHWHDRVGLGLGSAMGEITDNRLYCCKESIGMAGFATTSLYYPAIRGVPLSGRYDANSISFWAIMLETGEKIYPLVFDTFGNRAWGGWRGIETWTASSAPDDKEVKVTTQARDVVPVPNDWHVKHFFPGMEIVHCRQSTDLQDQRETALYGWKIRGDYSSPAPVDGGTNTTYAIDLKGAYRFGITLEDCELSGHGAAYRLVDDGEYTRFIGCKFDCPVINYMDSGRKVQVGGAWEGTWDDCEFIGNPLFADGWYPKYDLSLWLQKNRKDFKAIPATRYFVRPWCDGRDYQVFHYEQHPDWQHVKGDPGTAAYGDLPPGVWAQRQLIDLGTPIFGDAVPEHAVQWGKFYAAELDCCVQREFWRAKYEALKAQGN